MCEQQNNCTKLVILRVPTGSELLISVCAGSSLARIRATANGGFVLTRRYNKELKFIAQVNKEEFAARLQRRTGGTMTLAKGYVNEFIAVLTEALVNNERVLFQGFGSFEVKEVPPRMGVHPVTKERKIVKAYKKPKFTAGDELKSSIRGKS